MKKSFVFCLLAGLFAASLAFADETPLDVTFDDAGCLSGGVYFRLACDDDEQVCTISQESVAEPTEMDFACWKDTLRVGAETADRGLVSTVNSSTYENYAIELGSSLNLGGYNETAASCYMGFSPLSANHGSFNGNNHTVFNFCYLSTGSSGFFDLKYGYFSSIKDVSFSNARVTGGEYVGVVIPRVRQATVSGVTIDGAVLAGDTVGGITGNFYGCTASNLSVSNVSVSAYYAGGALAGKSEVIMEGQFTLSDNIITGEGSLGGVFGIVYGIDASASTLIASNTKVSSGSTSSNVGGIAGFLEQSGTAGDFTTDPVITRFGIQGTLSGKGNVGALFGKVRFSTATTSNNYFIGEMECSEAEACGYVAGYLTSEEGGGSLYNNYYYGEDEVAVGIGKVGESAYDVETWNTGSQYVYRNARNSTSGLAKTGTLKIHHSYLVDGSNSFRNGVVDADSMKTDYFAWIMNHGSSGNTEVWTRASGENEGLPFIANERYLPIFAIRFAGSGGHTVIDQRGDDAFYMYTDYQHKLSATDIESLQDMLPEGLFWDGDVSLDPNTVYTEELSYNVGSVSEDIDVVFYMDDMDTSWIDYYVSTDYQDIPVPFNTAVDYGRYVYLPKFYGKSHLSTSQVRLVGWTTDPERNGCYGSNTGTCDTTKTGWIYKELNEQLVIDATLQERRVAASDGKNASITLYPVWADERNQGVKIYIENCLVVGEENKCEGFEDAVQFVFSQTFDVAGKTYTWYHYPEDYYDASYGESRPTLFGYASNGNLYIKMQVETKLDENFVAKESRFSSTVNVMTYDESSREFVMPVMSGTSLVARFYTYLAAKKYFVSFDLNVPESSYENLYFPSEASAVDSLLFETADERRSLWEPYSTDQCFYGWSTEKDSPDGILYDVDLESAVLSALSYEKKSPTTLYAYWQTCEETPETFVALKGNDESVQIAIKQKFGNREYTHRVTGDGISLGSSAYVFYVDTANSVVPQGYVLRDFSVYYSFTDGTGAPHGPDALPVEEDGSFIVMPRAAQGESVPAMTTYTLGAEVRLAPTHLTFNTEKADSLYYGKDWVSEGDYEIGDKETPLPIYVYSSDKCLVGWATSESAEMTHTAFGPMLWEELQDWENPDSETALAHDAKLVARWTTNIDSCAGAFIRVGVEQENGKIQLVEKVGGKLVTHAFAADGTMLLPLDISGDSLTVRSVAGLDYVLDSLVVLRGDEVVAVLHEGDVLPSSLERLTLRAFFTKGEVIPVEFAESKFLQSGSMIQLSFKLRDFEVPSGVSARVKVVDLSKNVAVIDSLLSKAVTKGYGNTVTLRVKNPGDFRVFLTIAGTEKIAEYSKTFSIKAEVASAPADSWQMLSLSAVDTSAIVWDDDPRFYWWDEDGYGAFWQYKLFEKGDSVIDPRGMWYSSLEGRPLVMRNDIEDSGDDSVWDMDSTQSGWNLMANAHGWIVDLYAGHSAKENTPDEESEVSFWRYDPETADYKETRYAEPYEAIWAKVSKKTSWVVSAEPVFQIADSADSKVDGGMKKIGSLAKTTARERWTLQAVLSDRNGKRDSWNMLGVSDRPFVAEEPPASIGDHVKLSIVEGKNSLAKSVKAPVDEMEWTISLSASTDRSGSLTLAGIDGVKAYGYHVYVTVDGNTTEMQEGVPLNVMLKSSATTATVRVAPSARVVATSVLKGLRAARLGGNRLQVSFDASEGLAGTNASVDLMDMRGHVVSSVSAQAVIGKNALVLDAPKAGLYVVRVRAGTQQQSAKVVVK